MKSIYLDVKWEREKGTGSGLRRRGVREGNGLRRKGKCGRGKGGGREKGMWFRNSWYCLGCRKETTAVNLLVLFPEKIQIWWGSPGILRAPSEAVTRLTNINSVSHNHIAATL